MCAVNFLAEVGVSQKASWFCSGTSRTVVQADLENKRLNRLVMSQP